MDLDKCKLQQFLGLAFVRTGITSRFLVSLAEYGSAQNVLRNHFFEHSEIAFLCSNVDNEVPADILKRLLESISDNEEAFICIDNLGIQSHRCLKLIQYSFNFISRFSICGLFEPDQETI